MINPQTLLWCGFATIVFIMIVLDLSAFHKKAHAVGMKEALAWSGAWITLALGFAVAIFFVQGKTQAFTFTAGYLTELSLSIDNLFVFILVFSYFRIDPRHQHRILFWGIFGAVVMRALFIVAGIALIEKFAWIMYVFGAFLLGTAIKMALRKENEEMHPEKNWIVRIFRRVMPIATRYEGDRFFIIENGRRFATPLFLALLVIESSDVLFAVDSIPAIFGITLDPFIVYTSNVFAILGLRNLYFALSGLMRLFHHLEHGLAFILAFIGVKMLIAHFVHISVVVSLSVIALSIALSIVASLVWKKVED